MVPRRTRSAHEDGSERRTTLTNMCEKVGDAEPSMRCGSTLRRSRAPISCGIRRALSCIPAGWCDLSLVTAGLPRCEGYRSMVAVLIACEWPFEGVALQT
jgi:hypothetical protein